VLTSACGGNGTSGSSGTSVACDTSKLAGYWTRSSFSLRIANDWSYDAAEAPNDAMIDVRGTAAVDGCTIRFTDTSGQFACPSTQVGTYTYTVSDTTLHFSTASGADDACDGRRSAVSGTTLTRTSG
jgi:hypothetical protein